MDVTISSFILPSFLLLRLRYLFLITFIKGVILLTPLTILVSLILMKPF
nr:MAG TPA: hypothetical protein [Caudoviricetes sp.]